LQGRAAVAGFVCGTVIRHRRAAPELPRDGQGADAERARLEAALARVAGRLAAEVDGPRAAIAAAHAAIVADPALIEAVEADLSAGRSAEWAWNAACSSEADV
ncbi:hypothetical protein J8J40_25530, partial [Mycobacterium tuberculosis]|nr:hypothetical protein [Mycobacterium tuberculosis]